MVDSPEQELQIGDTKIKLIQKYVEGFFRGTENVTAKAHWNRELCLPKVKENIKKPERFQSKQRKKC